MKAEIEVLKANLEKTEKKLASHEEFSLPYSLKASKLVVAHKEAGITDELLKFVRDLLCEGFAQKSSILDIAEFAKDQLDQKDGGYWLCEIFHQDSISNSDHACQEQKWLILTFKRNYMTYQANFAKTCKGECEQKV